MKRSKAGVKKYKSCTAETGKFCSKHQVVHKPQIQEEQEDEVLNLPKTKEDCYFFGVKMERERNKKVLADSEAKIKELEATVKRFQENGPIMIGYARQAEQEKVKRLIAEKDKLIKDLDAAYALAIKASNKWEKLSRNLVEENKCLKAELEKNKETRNYFDDFEKQALSDFKRELREKLKEEIKKAENIREDRFDTASLSVGIRNKQFHRTAVKYKGMVIAFNKVLELLEEKGNEKRVG